MIWEQGWRDALWAELKAKPQYDLIIVGGGITGAGILREASRVGIRALLIEQGDFASGTSSRSSKLVHGGMRYLKTGQWGLTLESVRERKRLLKEAGGLVTEQGFVTALFSDRKPGWWMIKLGMIIYDIMARQRRFLTLLPNALLWRVPRLRQAYLRGGFWHPDA
ncbi:MAG: FAD-dependent oxidoreductase, partial [Salinisphaeraceae bacterium]|nr:FAD-dependent oxidoreductase [Salinisphaeraceae bacterium]